MTSGYWKRPLFGRDVVVALCGFAAACFLLGYVLGTIR